MLKIDYDLFIKNLLKTQEYCQLQMEYLDSNDSLLDISSVFRSFNPEINDKAIFEFGLEEYYNNDSLVPKLVKSVEWTSDPIDNCGYMDRLFTDQLAYKEKCLEGVAFDKKYPGAVVISQIDYSVFDGASAAESYYLFDLYDMPPIDTWFYLLNGGATRLLFAYIPEKYCTYAQDAIAVNCVDCIGWFEERYPKEYKRFTTEFNNLSLK